MSSAPPPSLRRRGGKKDIDAADNAAATSSIKGNALVKESEWDYKVAMGVLTALGFLTRFWNIAYPDEVVFDEVHFGKVRYFSWKHGYLLRVARCLLS